MTFFVCNNKDLTIDMVCLLPIEEKTMLTQITCENTHTQKLKCLVYISK